MVRRPVLDSAGEWEEVWVLGSAEEWEGAEEVDLAGEADSAGEWEEAGALDSAGEWGANGPAETPAETGIKIIMKTDVLVIGGGPGGVIAAVTAKKHYPEKKVSLIREKEKSIIPCGIPYLFRRLDSVDEDILGDKPLLEIKIDLIIEEVSELNTKEKRVALKDGRTFEYEKLILALGSSPRKIPIAGIEKEGVWLVKKDYDYLKRLREAVLKAKKIAIVGGGFIGLEFADEISGIKGKEVSIIERMDHCLAANFDTEFALAAEEQLREKGVRLLTGRSVKEVGGRQRVEYIELEGGQRVPAEMLILSAGARPEIGLAQKAGIKTEERGGIWVDEYLRTSAPDVFAVGDCAQTRDFITGKDIPVMLASVATSEARIAGSNLYKIELIRENRGTTGVFSTKIGDLTLGAAGLIEERLKEEGIDYVVGQAEAPNRHPARLPGMEKIKVKLLFSRSSENLLLGGEMMGPESVGEMINILAMSIQQEASLFDFNTWQIATHPLLTSGPTAYPIIQAAQNIAMQHIGRNV